MKLKKWQVILAAIMSLLIMVITPLAVFAAQDDQATASDRPRMEGGLAIVAPRVVQVGKEMSLGVFLRQNQEPVAGATVWGISRDAVETLKSELSTLKAKRTNLVESDIETTLGNKAFRIGKTKDDGRIFYTFQETGAFVMIAFKAHYWPDLAGIKVKNPIQALAIQAPRKAAIGEPVIITVSQRGTGEAVQDAAVWAIGRNEAAALKEAAAKIRTAGNAQDADWDSVVKLYGTKLGKTNGDGKLKADFDNAGGYLLAALKQGNIPGYTGIMIVAPETVETPDAQTTE